MCCHLLSLKIQCCILGILYDFLMTLCSFLSFYSCVFVPTSVLSAKGVLRKNDIAQNRRFFSQQAATAAGTYGDCNAGSEVVHWKRANGFAEGTVKLLILLFGVAFHRQTLQLKARSEQQALAEPCLQFRQEQVCRPNGLG